MNSTHNPHYTILNNLNNLYRNNKNNPDVVDAVVEIGWALGMDLKYDFGYFELSELAGHESVATPEGLKHYNDVIETNLKKLQG